MKGNYDRDKVQDQTEQIFSTCMEVVDYAEENDVTTHAAALKIAIERIENSGK